MQVSKFLEALTFKSKVLLSLYYHSLLTPVLFSSKVLSVICFCLISYHAASCWVSGSRRSGKTRPQALIDIDRIAPVLNLSNLPLHSH